MSLLADPEPRGAAWPRRTRPPRRWRRSRAGQAACPIVLLEVRAVGAPSPAANYSPPRRGHRTGPRGTWPSGRASGVLASGSGTILEAILGADLPSRSSSSTSPARPPRWRVPRARRRPGRARRLRPRLRPGRHAAGGRRWPPRHRPGRHGGLRHGPGRAVHDLPGRILNTHPAPLPSFRAGTRCRRRWFGVKVTGCTVHLAASRWTRARSSPRRPCRCCPTTPSSPLHERIGTSSAGSPGHHPGGRRGRRPPDPARNAS